MTKLLAWLVVLAIALLMGPLAWNCAAPLFGLPQLTFWQFFVAGIAFRCLLGTTGGVSK